MITSRLKISVFTVLSGKEKMLFLEAFLLHLWVGLVLKFIPFRRIPKLFASRQTSVGSKTLDVMMVRRAVERANVVSPWKNRCLVSSLAARRMLSGRGIESQLSLGVAKNADGKTAAHAWLSAGDHEIVSRGSGYTELYFF